MRALTVLAIALALSACTAPAPKFAKNAPTIVDVEGKTFEVYESEDAQIFTRLASPVAMIDSTTMNRWLLAATRKGARCPIDPASTTYASGMMQAALDCG